MNPHYAAVPGDTTIQQLVDHHILAIGQRSFLVKSEDHVIGLLTLHHIKEVPRSQWPTTTAAQIIIPMAQMKTVRPDTGLWEALEEMDRDGVNQLPLTVDGRIQGMLSREDIISYLRTMRELRA
jgi:CBS domain-containing protein